MAKEMSDKLKILKPYTIADYFEWCKDVPIPTLEQVDGFIKFVQNLDNNKFYCGIRYKNPHPILVYVNPDAEYPTEFRFYHSEMREVNFVNQFRDRWGFLSFHLFYDADAVDTLIYELRRYVVPVTAVLSDVYLKPPQDRRTDQQIVEERERQKLDLAAKTIALIQEVRLNTGR